MANGTRSVLDSAFLPLCTEEDIRYILFNFNRRKSPGLDGVSVDVLCKHFEQLKHVLLAILNNIISTQIVPIGLKQALDQCSKVGKKTMSKIIGVFKSYQP